MTRIVCVSVFVCDCVTGFVRQGFPAKFSDGVVTAKLCMFTMRMSFISWLMSS